MAKDKKEKEGRILADEKAIEAIIGFATRHRAKIIAGLAVVLAVTLVWVLSTHAERSHESEVAEYLEENLYKPLGIFEGSNPFMDQSSEPEKPIKVDEILEKVKDSEARPFVLWLLSKYLFQQGGEPNLRKAKKLCQTLRDEYVDPRYELYQSFADELLSKIEDELSWKAPQSVPVGPPAPPEEYLKSTEKKKEETGKAQEKGKTPEKKKSEVPQGESSTAEGKGKKQGKPEAMKEKGPKPEEGADKKGKEGESHRSPQETPPLK